jgi:translation initiation factor 1 (eIF-1/SUI1)
MLFPREIRNIEKNTNNTKKLSPKAARLLKQRTSGGNIDSNIQTSMMGGGKNGKGQLFPEKQAIQIRVVKRGNKVVTMVQGMTLPFKERKVLLKEMKSKLGGGGALVEGVLELQGAHSEKILEYLKSKGYSGAKIVK